MEWGAVLDLVQSGGALAVTGLVIVTGLRQQWLFRWQHDLIVSQMQQRIDALTTDRDRWQEAALRGTSLAREAINTAARVGGS